MKRLLHKIPGVRTKLGTYATALFLLKQHFSDQVEDENAVETTFINWLVDQGYITEEDLQEMTFADFADMLPKGTYKVGVDIIPNEDYPGSAKKGDVVVFRSYLRHRVSPITKGKRKSLVAWYHGKVKPKIKK